MKFKIYFLTIGLVLTILPAFSAPYEVDGKYVGEFHRQWLDNEECNPSDGKADIAYAVVEGAWRVQPFEFPRGIKFEGNPSRLRSDGHLNIEWVDFYYKFKTQNGTAIANVDYVPITDGELYWGNKYFSIQNRYSPHVYVYMQSGHHQEVKTTSKKANGGMKRNGVECKYYHINFYYPKLRFGHVVHGNKYTGQQYFDQEYENPRFTLSENVKNSFARSYTMRIVIYPKN